jgi:hypothetical protein
MSCIGIIYIAESLLCDSVALGLMTQIWARGWGRLRRRRWWSQGPRVDVKVWGYREAAGEELRGIEEVGGGRGERRRKEKDATETEARRREEGEGARREGVTMPLAQ